MTTARKQINAEQAADNRALEANRAFFDAVAGHYDQGREAYFRHDLTRVRQEFLRYLAPVLPADPLVLDFGCGTGFYALALAGLGCRRFHCVDLNDAFLEQTRAKLQQCNPAAQVRVMKADLAQFCEAAATLPRFDLMVIGSVLQYIQDHPALLAQLAQAQPQATYYITSHQLGPHRRLAGMEEAVARLDYFCHRLQTRRPRVARSQQTAVMGPVDAPSLERVFSTRGFGVTRSVYTTYHTGFFNGWHRVLKRLHASSGSYFSLIASPATTDGEWA